MSEAQMCCGTTCSKGVVLRAQSRVVAAFDEVDRRQSEFNPEDPDVEGLEASFDELRSAIVYLREKD